MDFVVILYRHTYNKHPTSARLIALEIGHVHLWINALVFVLVSKMACVV